MKAAQITGYGDKNVIQVAENVPKPVISPDQVLVAVYAAGVNPFDIKTRSGLTRNYKELDFPAVLGGDFAGVVAEVGGNVFGVAVGEEIYGQTDALSGKGSFAEFTPVASSQIALKPKSVDFVTAAALPLAGVSALQALVDHANLQNGQKILIHGGAGGIGTYAIQLAKHIGAHVTTTALKEDFDYVKGLGADEIIDYKIQDFATMLQNYDAVYDTVGGETYAKSYQVLKQGGVIVSMLERPDEALQKQYGVEAISQFTQVTTERLSMLAELVDNGAIKVHIDKTFPLEEAAEALAYLEQGKHKGKVVIQVK